METVRADNTCLPKIDFAFESGAVKKPNARAGPGPAQPARHVYGYCKTQSKTVSRGSREAHSHRHTVIYKASRRSFDAKLRSSSKDRRIEGLTSRTRL
ncbi:hypothetical protein EVAR_23309_1 [Eumeta japonica]|uniref:Uncharacterized protein n=1 Tax=Eumeta variegata TaxID=151549 RepID=A0A4C1XX54_EUMVA|nr:hypothetical protein EVAR_23309_1 [Eumeta japonica]